MTEEDKALIEEARAVGRPGWKHSFADCFRMIRRLADRLEALTTQTESERS
jgi:hypothetical protein